MSHLDSARTIVDALEAVTGAATEHLAHATEKDGRVSVSLMDQHQTVVYDVATMASTVRAARALVAYGEHGDHEAALAHAFAADTAAELRGRLAGREDEWGTTAEALAGVADEIRAGRDTDLLASIADTVISNKGEAGPRHLPEELDMVRDAFRRFAEDKVMPVAEEVHRHDQDIPDEIISGLAEMGCFALSIPAEYGGMQEGGDDELLNMVLVTEELSRGSLGVAGSLITRPEIIGTAIQKGGTEEQKQRWLPSIASGEKMCGVAVTEPDYGSDVAGVKVTATRDGDDWVINGVKTWCTFAGKAEYLLVLARTDPDRSLGHKGLSLFVVDKPAFEGHEWSVEQEDGGRMEAKAIPTIGYRGHALLRGLHRLVACAARQPHRRGRRPRARLLPADAGLRQRAAADRGAGAGRDAVGHRGGLDLRAAAAGVRHAAGGLRAHQVQDRPHGLPHRGEPVVRVRGRPA